MVAYAKPSRFHANLELLRVSEFIGLWAHLHEALGEVEAQPRFSRKEKGKAPLSVDGVAYAASTRGAQSPLSREAELGARWKVKREASLISPNQRALVSSADFAPLNEVKGLPPSTDSIAYAASAPM